MKSVNEKVRLRDSPQAVWTRFSAQPHFAQRGLVTATVIEWQELFPSSNPLPSKIRRLAALGNQQSLLFALEPEPALTFKRLLLFLSLDTL